MNLYSKCLTALLKPQIKKLKKKIGRSRLQQKKKMKNERRKGEKFFTEEFLILYVMNYVYKVTLILIYYIFAKNNE